MKRKIAFGLFALLISLAVGSCGSAGKHPALTAWPKYIPAQTAPISFEGIQLPGSQSCPIRAVDLIGAWVAAKSPEQAAFPFTDINGLACQGTFAVDVLPLFTQANLWYAGALSCRTCHGPDIPVSYARLDMSSYAGIMAGSGRDSADVQGDDILGGGNWEQAELYKQLTNGDMPPNRPSTVDPKGPIVYTKGSQ